LVQAFLKKWWVECYLFHSFIHSFIHCIVPLFSSWRLTVTDEFAYKRHYANTIQLVHACSGNTIDPRCWIWLENCCLRPKATVHKASPAPRDNSFDCSLNRHELTVLLSCTHAHNHKSTEDNLSIPLKNWSTTLFWKKYSTWQEWRTAHRSPAWNSSDPEVEEQSTVSLRRLF
jgi:hypothetical protein